MRRAAAPGAAIFSSAASSAPISISRGPARFDTDVRAARRAGPRGAVDEAADGTDPDAPSGDASQSPDGHADESAHAPAPRLQSDDRDDGDGQSGPGGHAPRRARRRDRGRPRARRGVEQGRVGRGNATAASASWPTIPRRAAAPGPGAAGRATRTGPIRCCASPRRRRCATTCWSRCIWASPAGKRRSASSSSRTSTRAASRRAPPRSWRPTSRAFAGEPVTEAEVAAVLEKLKATLEPAGRLRGERRGDRSRSSSSVRARKPGPS